MDTHLIDGKNIAAQLRSEIAAEVGRLSIKPGLAVILVGENPASQVYVGNKIKACEKAGIQSVSHHLPADTPAADLYALIRALNADPAVHGILLQLPLPEHLDPNDFILAIDPEKDVDGLHPLNAGRLMAGLPGMVPCTPQGALRLIKSVRNDLSGLDAVVIGRSLLFGKPMGQLLLSENCTVTQAHSRTRKLPDLSRRADILVAAVGRSEMVEGSWIKPGAIVIDVGINRGEDGKLRGDIDFAQAQGIAGAITPVPGGVGPMTIACLLLNTLRACQKFADHGGQNAGRP